MISFLRGMYFRVTKRSNISSKCARYDMKFSIQICYEKFNSLFYSGIFSIHIEIYWDTNEGFKILPKRLQICYVVLWVTSTGYCFRCDLESKLHVLSPHNFPTDPEKNIQGSLLSNLFTYLQYACNVIIY